MGGIHVGQRGCVRATHEWESERKMIGGSITPFSREVYVILRISVYFPMSCEFGYLTHPASPRTCPSGVVSVSTGLDIECKVLCGVQHEIYILRNHSIPKAWQIRDHRSKNTPSIPEVTIVIDRRQKKRTTPEQKNCCKTRLKTRVRIS